MPKKKRRYFHFQLELENTNFVYTYIRKNGCTSFKNLFLSESPMKGKVKECKNPLHFMMLHHKVKSLEKVNTIPNRIAVIRDPRQRVVSAYTNRIIQDYERDSDLLNTVSQALSIPRKSLTFRMFVTKYLTINSIGKIDCHLWSQKEHMAGIEYNHLWLLDNLYDNAEDLFGTEIASKFFLKKVNSTSDKTKYSDNVANLPLHKLYDRYVGENSLPNSSALLTDELDEIVKNIYADDVHLYSQLEKSNRQLQQLK